MGKFCEKEQFFSGMVSGFEEICFHSFVNFFNFWISLSVFNELCALLFSYSHIPNLILFFC